MDTYYYLVAGLPDISLDDGKLSYTVDSFKSEIYPDLSDKDKKVIDLFYLKLDNDNLLHLLKDKDYAVVSQGMYSAEELLSVIDTVKDGDIPDKKYPSYFCNFISKYLKLNPEDLYKAGDMLAAQYYAYAMNCKNKFVSAWFEFNLNLNNIQAALSARKYKLDIASAIVGNTDVCESLRTSNARDFGLGDTLTYLENVQRIAEIDELVEREKKIDQLKWEWLETESFFNYFTIERLFVFLLQLEMIERWISLDKEKGSELFRAMIQDLKNDVQIPEEFRK
ncbi:DUF2764 family protein [Bacteroides caecigallinarum]|uniref:DUF2764 family protein n=1 Tax=Bacteroides caecigallinarum TaxID=1411144 RepID=UPI001F188FF2|nr:DUF2764 family protein [Bacteroides caecigallinarum]MCF2552394.1 DUF2764 domain-containing protein [Bacteroides caecigallinarum]